MLKISLGILISTFNFNPAELIGRKVHMGQHNTRGGSRIRASVIVKQMNADEFNDGKGWYNTSDFYLEEYLIEDLEKIIAGLDKVSSNYKDMRNYCKERGLKKYDFIEIGIQKVLDSVKKSKIEEGRTLLRDFVKSSIL